jgi:hypothetical protein
MFFFYFFKKKIPFHFIKGDIAIRDGEFIHEELWVYKIQGVYNLLKGKQEIQLNPLRSFSFLRISFCFGSKSKFG